MDDGYRFELMDPTSPRELASTSRLLRRVFPKARHLTPDYLRWQYADNPDGAAVACNAWLGEELVGHLGGVTMAGQVEGEPKRGVFLLNGAIDAAHRGKRLQSRISDAIFAEALRRGFVFSFGSGNRWSTGPLLSRHKLLHPLEVRIGFGRPRRRKDATAASFKRLWSEDSLRWRLANPERRYKVREGRQGVTVYAPTGVPGIDAILYESADLSAGIEVSGREPAAARLWLGLDPGIDWRRSTFVTIPQRLRPSPLNLVYRDMTGGGFVPDPDRVVFTAFDFDPY